MNKAMFIGYVEREPKVSYYAYDQATAEVRLATTERGYRLPNGTQVPERTDWHTIIFYRNLAKFVERNVHEGDRIYVEGRVRNRYDDDPQGIRLVVTEIIAEKLELLSAKQPTHSAHTHYEPTHNEPTHNEPEPADSDASEDSPTL